MIIEKGRFQVEKKGGEILETETLGSCVALAARDREAEVYGLWVFVLPAIKILPYRIENIPEAFFANEGLDEFLAELESNGAALERTEFYSAGGARFLEAPTIFDLGGLNASMIRKLLKDRKLKLAKEHCGRPFPSRLIVNPVSDEIVLKISGEEEEKW